MRPSLPLLTLALLALPAWGQEGPLVIHKKNVPDYKAVMGTVEAVHEIAARARIGGTITALYVKEGDAVEAGAKVAIISDKKLAIRGRGFDARISAAQSAFQKAKQDFERAKELRESGYGTQARLDEATSALKIAENNWRAVEAEAQEVSQQSAEGIVTAPSAGRVLNVPIALGSVVMPGDTLATLTQEDYVLRLELPERHARFLKAGDSVKIGARGGNSADFSSDKMGTVRLIYPTIKEGRVIADVAVGEAGPYFVGERTRVYLSTGTREAFFLPKEALLKRAGVTLVKLKSGQEVAVQTGQTQGDDIEILAGLAEGDEVIKP